MERREVIDIICKIVRGAPGAPEKVDENTCLFGAKGFLDSLKLVSVVLDTEQQINDTYNIAISLADNRTVSAGRSPFRSVASLADYILEVAAEQTRA
jgi:acyl carrier protein